MPTTLTRFTGTLKVQVLDPPSDPVYYYLSSQFRGYDNPSGVKRPKPHRWKAPTAYSRSVSKVSSALSISTCYESKTVGGNKASKQQFFGDWAHFAPTSSVVPVPSSYQALLNQCLRDMVDQKFNLLTSVAEFRKTAEHLASTAQRLTAAVVDVKRGKFARAARRLRVVKPKGASRSKTFSQNWLEYKYGWMPLVSDAYGVMEHLASYYRDEAPIYSVRKRAVDTGTFEPPVTKHSWYSWEASVKHRATFRSTRQVVLYYQVDYSSLANLKRLGILDPEATAWERIPWSFVADWFLPIGEYLQLTRAWQGMIYKGGTHTTTVKSQLRSDLLSCKYSRARPDNTLVNTSEQIRPGLSEAYVLQRTVIRDPRYRIMFKNPVSVDHAVTAIALLRSQFR